MSVSKCVCIHSFSYVLVKFIIIRLFYLVAVKSIVVRTFTWHQ